MNKFNWIVFAFSLIFSNIIDIATVLVFCMISTNKYLVEGPLLLIIVLLLGFV
jgi:hypothetical protein